MVTVMLRADATGPFRRKGIVFEPRKPVLLTDQEFVDLASDIGHALKPVELRADGKPLPLSMDEIDLPAMIEEAQMRIATDPGTPANESNSSGQNQRRRK